MADIISLENRLQLSQDKKDALVRKRKILAVQKVFQCTRCSLKCEKCGVHITSNESACTAHEHKTGCPYRFCESCLDEYRDFIQKLKGKEDTTCYWRNEAWFESWRLWIDYQAAMDRYLKTPEFLQLVQEFRRNRLDD